MNDNREFELLTEEELKKLDENLKKAENVELPENNRRIECFENRT